MGRGRSLRGSSGARPTCARGGEGELVIHEEEKKKSGEPAHLGPLRVEQDVLHVGTQLEARPSKLVAVLLHTIAVLVHAS